MQHSESLRCSVPGTMWLLNSLQLISGYQASIRRQFARRNEHYFKINVCSAGYKTYFVWVPSVFPTLRTLRYATLLVSEVRPRVSGEAPRANGGVVWVTAVVLSEILLPERLRHEPVKSTVAVTQTKTCTEPGRQIFQPARTAIIFFFNPGPWCLPSLFYLRQDVQSSAHCSKTLRGQTCQEWRVKTNKRKRKVKANASGSKPWWRGVINERKDNSM